jgi:poly(3-hydroxybutyrate) depolymerase
MRILGLVAVTGLMACAPASDGENAFVTTLSTGGFEDTASEDSSGVADDDGPEQPFDLGSSGEDEGDEDTGTDDGDEPEENPDALPSPGCGSAPPGVKPSAIQAHGMQRTFVLDVPPDYDPDHAYPLVFGWHGTGHQGANAQQQMQLMQIAQNQVIAVYPNGSSSAPVWQFPGGASVTDPQRDLALFDALVNELGSAYCVDGNMIFSTGFSQGAYLSNSLGCERANVLRGIAPVAGGGPWSCNPAPMAAFVVVGKSDSVAHENGPYGYANSAQRSRDFWLQGGGCSSASSPSNPSPCVLYDCPEENPVVFCEHVGGHTWWSQATIGMMAFFSELQG